MRTPCRMAISGSVLMILSEFAAAQTAPTPDTNEGGLQEVTVTATKQAAIDVLKVPISISAYGQQEMDQRGVRNIGDIAAITPGLTFSRAERQWDAADEYRDPRHPVPYQCADHRHLPR